MRTGLLKRNERDRGDPGFEVRGVAICSQRVWGPYTYVNEV